MEKHYYLEPLYTDSSKDTPGVLMRKRDVTSSGSSETMTEGIGNLDEDTHALQKQDKVRELKAPRRAVSVETSEVRAGSQAPLVS